jgi:hypothetical protein
MRRAIKFWSLPACEKKLLCEASVLLLLSATGIKTIAFRHIDRFLRIHWNDGVRGGNDHQHESQLIRRSVSRAANALPWKSLCLSRSIAEFIMLRRRGIPAVLFAGVKFSGHSSLDAHAWVNTGLGMNDKNSDDSDFVTVIRIGTEPLNQ